MLKRKAYEKLLEWKQQQAGKTAVLIEGARRVGKSTLAKEFGLNEYKSCLVIDFFQAPDEVKQYFRDYSNDFDALFLYLIPSSCSTARASSFSMKCRCSPSRGGL